MGSNSVVDMIEASSGPHFSGFHMDGLDTRNTQVEQPTTSSADKMYKQPFVIVVYHPLRSLNLDGTGSIRDSNEELLVEQLLGRLPFVI